MPSKSCPENSKTKISYCVCETIFKLQYRNHNKSFNHRKSKSDTELSNEFWKINYNKRNTNITWETLDRRQAYNTSSKRCLICLNEKLKIVLHKYNNMSKKRTEILNRCRHRKKYLYLSPTIGRRTCNCINMLQCPLDQKCLSNNISYPAKIAPLYENSKFKISYCVCETTFKLQYRNHNKSFNHRKRKLDTELSSKFWKINYNKRNTNITWDTLDRAQAYNTSSKRCLICLNEKLKTILHKYNNMSKKRTEILNRCRRRNKFAVTSHDVKY